MSWTINDRFPSWGESGASPADGFFYEGGDQVNEKHLDYLWNSIRGLEDDIQSALNDIDSDADGVVDEADTLTAGGSLNGDLNALDGETIWDESAGYIPQARLQNDSLSVNGGDGIKNGGAVSLGGSVSLDIEPVDFAGTGVNDDGADNLELNESVIKDGGAKEIDAAEFDASSGSSGQVLKSDGSSASWGSASAEPIYGDGSDGSITDNSNITRSGVISATDYTLQSGNTVTVGQNGVLIIVAQNSITINGTIDANGAGGNGGAGGDVQDSPNTNAPPGEVGGEGIFSPVGLGGSGGVNNGDYESDGGNGGDGTTAQPNHQKQLQFTFSPFYQLEGGLVVGAGGGGGGGGGMTDLDTTTDGTNGSPPGGGGGGGIIDDPNFEASLSQGGDGGAGGGGIFLLAPSIEINGTITVEGADGQNSASADASGGGGGGGSGGIIYLRANDLVENSPTYSVSGGAGGSAGSATAQGGDGASGASGQTIKIT